MSLVPSAATSRDVDPFHVRAVAGLFDPAFYLACYPDVGATGLDPLQHFLRIGWREGYNPRADFNVNYYLHTHPDVKAAGINPLVHYALTGATEGRATRRPMDAERTRLEEARCPHEAAKDWADAADTSESLAVSALRRALLTTAAGREALVVALSHDDYEHNFGGVQNVIREEREELERAHCAYLHLCPAAPVPSLAEDRPDGRFRWQARLGGERLGVVEEAAIMAALDAVGRATTPVVLVVHHLMGTAPEAVARLARATAGPTIVWIHDFFTLCSSYNLLRNDVRFCNAPPEDSAGCNICVYGSKRPLHRARMHAFFQAVRPIVLAPSAGALNFWRQEGSLPYSDGFVQPLARLVGAREASIPFGSDPGREIRIAHLGQPVVTKGWAVFEDLARRFGGRSGYVFYELGIGDPRTAGQGVRRVPVRVSRRDPRAMINAIAEHRIDAVVIWSIWPETFCFTAYETLAGGAFLIARAAAGNVPNVLLSHAPEQGCIVEDETVLNDLFASGRLRSKLKEAPRSRGAIVTEAGSADWVKRWLAARRSLSGVAFSAGNPLHRIWANA